MHIRTRKLVGTIVLVVFLIVYSLFMMTVGANHYADGSLHTKFIFYILAGIGWVIPAMPLVWWMQRP